MAWAWRFFLTRPHNLLLSSIRPAHRHGSQLSTLYGSNKPISPRGYASKSTDDPHAKVKRHLYLVLDDHEDGYGVHKLDLSDDDNDHLDSGARRLPEPPVFRVELTTLGERAQFAAVGSSIVAIGTTLTSPLLFERYIPGKIGGVLIYNTKTGLLTVTPHLPAGLAQDGYKAAMAIGNTLYMLGSAPPYFKWKSGGSLHCLTADIDQVDARGDQFWDWLPLSRNLPWLWSSFENPPRLPFLADHIMALVAHASPRRPAADPKIMVSLRPTEMNPLGATFSFSTRSRRWKRRCWWHVPVVGYVHYDVQLDAWVGLHAVSDGNVYGPPVTDGHLCVGNKISTQSEWKAGKEKLFRLDEDCAAGWRHVDAKLVPIKSDEGGSEYCLIERLCSEEKEGEIESKERDEKVEQERWGNIGNGLLRLTSFSVERGQHGEPMTTARRLARSYEVSWHSRHFDVQAFWL